MLTVIEQAKNYLAKTADLAREAITPLWKALEPEVQKEASRLRKESFYTEENRVGDHRTVHTSPGGEYILVVDSYTTGEGTWAYTRGRVSGADDTETAEPIADVKRNYSSFPFAWVINHATGHDFLICGEDYQGQTFIDLTTGESANNMSHGASKGFGFCWAAYSLMPDGVTLKVEGCHWACPYEYKFFDVSDPIGKGWPELGLPDEVGDLYETETTSLDYEDGLFVWQDSDYVFKATGERNSEIEGEWSRLFGIKHKAEHLKEPQEIVNAAQAEIDAHDAKYPDHEDEPDLWDKVVDHTIKFRNDGGTLVLVDEWKSEHLLERHKQYEEWNEKSKAERRAWRDSDPLYQALAEKTDDLRTHFSYPSQVSKWDGEANPGFFHVSANPEVHGDRQANLVWGVEEGPVKVKMWVRGKGDIAKPEFPRTSEGLDEAWEAARQHIAVEK